MLVMTAVLLGHSAVDDAVYSSVSGIEFVNRSVFANCPCGPGALNAGRGPSLGIFIVVLRMITREPQIDC